jgi:methionyl-tRNA synthetase
MLSEYVETDMSSRRILVTSALPYANGSIHIGHLVEYVQTDIWVRFQKMRGHHCVYVCADDAHGTPVMLRGRQEGISPQELIDRMHREHVEDFAGFLVDFDNYHTTHSEENHRLAVLFYTRLRDGGFITRRTITQAYDEEAGMFLPDRFIRGTCPACGAADQYGDSCEACGSTYSPSDLKDAVSVVSGKPPSRRESEHYFVRLGAFEEMLRDWTSGERLQPEIRNKLQEWFQAGLQDWDISRDAPYWGFEIPDAPGKYFYVWLDAPIGYMASFENLCARTGLSFDEYWAEDSTAELYHFIGKDIAYFHTLFWPAMLHGAGFRKPTAVFVHGFLTVDGEKMSKSRGTFIKARTYLRHLDPEYLRYYFAAKLTGGVEDIDLNLDDFVARVNSDLVGKFVNIASRCAGFVTRHFEGRLSEHLAQPEIYTRFARAADEIGGRMEGREYGKAVRRITGLADEANRFIDRMKPWVTVKDSATRGEAHQVCSLGLNLFRVLSTYLKPILPRTAANVEAFLNCDPLVWSSVSTPLKGHPIQPYRPLMTRIERAQLDRIVRDALEEEAPE